MKPAISPMNLALAILALLYLAQPQLAAADDDVTESEVKELEAKCEQAREAKLKPMRDAEIAKCKASKRNDPDYCERFWRDLGAATRLPNGSVRPRMFDDLPECVAAFKARRALVK
ncbi:MAG TPA: hypothetical protein VNQ81_09680 [Povalibacter sp.]|nr:hypothetical protein [Povalibacter sp.]